MDEGGGVVGDVVGAWGRERIFEGREGGKDGE